MIESQVRAVNRVPLAPEIRMGCPAWRRADRCSSAAACPAPSVNSCDPRLTEDRLPVVDDDRRQPVARVSREQCAVALEQTSDGIDAGVHLGERCELAWSDRTWIAVSYVPIDMGDNWCGGGREFVEIGRDDGRVDVPVDVARKVIAPPGAHAGDEPGG
jgi:hypothetical protein